MNRYLPLAATLTLIARPGFAQEPPATAAAAPENPAAAAIVAYDAFAGQNRPDWLDKKVSLEVKEMSAPAVVKTLLEKLEIKRFRIALGGNLAVTLLGSGVALPGGLGGDSSPHVFYDSAGKGDLNQPFATPVTLKLDEVKAEEAFKKVADVAGVRFTFREEDGFVTVEVAKTPKAVKVYTIGSAAVQFDPAVQDALKLSQVAVDALAAPKSGDTVLAPRALEALGSVWRTPPVNVAAPFPTPSTGMPLLSIARSSANLPKKRISLDVRDGDAREILKDLLKKARLDYALEEDLPEKKVSLTFENLPVDMALDTVCRTLGVGWTAETRDKKTVVRVGSKYGSGDLFGGAALWNGNFYPAKPSEGFTVFPVVSEPTKPAAVPTPDVAPSPEAEPEPV